MTNNFSQAEAKAIAQCQICDSQNLKPVIFLGYVPPVNTMHPVGDLIAAETFYSLGLQRCVNCTLVQNITEVAAPILFPPEYPYLSGTTRLLRDNFAELYQESRKMLGLTADDLIIDIGSNDGTLLSNFKEGGHRVLGVEPSRAAEAANQRGIPTLMKFFDKQLAEEIREKEGLAKVITAANVFAHISDVNSVVEGILSLLSPDGVFISESHYLLDLIETLQYDTVYHEHLRYYSLYALLQLFKRHNLEVFYVKRIPTHGGSIRVYTAHQGQKAVQPSVNTLLQLERDKGIVDGSALSDFPKRVLQSKTDLLSLLGELKKEGSRIYGIGAPSRASTLINYTGIDDGLVSCVMEVKGSHKLDKYVPGTRIAVLEETKLYQDQPEYSLILSWHLADELAAKIRGKGYQGKFIVPLPAPKILDV